MSVIIELFVRIVLELAAYGVGHVFVVIFLPWYRIESGSRHDPKEEHRWKWRGFSYLDSGRRVLYVESVQLIGLVIIVGLVAMGYGLSR